MKLNVPRDRQEIIKGRKTSVALRHIFDLMEIEVISYVVSENEVERPSRPT